MGFNRSVPHQLMRKPAPVAAAAFGAKAGPLKGHGALYVFFPVRPALFLAVADIGL
jgi:hypothetical protein